MARKPQSKKSVRKTDKRRLKRRRTNKTMKKYVKGGVEQPTLTFNSAVKSAIDIYTQAMIKEREDRIKKGMELQANALKEKYDTDLTALKEKYDTDLTNSDARIRQEIQDKVRVQNEKDCNAKLEEIEKKKNEECDKKIQASTLSSRLTSTAASFNNTASQAKASVVTQGKKATAAFSGLFGSKSSAQSTPPP